MLSAKRCVPTNGQRDKDKGYAVTPVGLVACIVTVCVCRHVCVCVLFFYRPSAISAQKSNLDGGLLQGRDVKVRGAFEKRDTCFNQGLSNDLRWFVRPTRDSIVRVCAIVSTRSWKFFFCYPAANCQEKTEKSTGFESLLQDSAKTGRIPAEVDIRVLCVVAGA